VRQWELFGITDDDPYWTPPQRSTADTIAIVPEVEDEEDEALLPEPAA
jgi:DNA gyrase inhibitor GyrI